MAERRRKSVRHRKRLKLRYGTEHTSQLAFTEDFCRDGFFIKTTGVLHPGTMVQVELFTPDNIPLTLEVQVVWGKRVPGSLIHLAKKGGMGVRILKFFSPDEEAAYLKLCSSLQTPP